MSIEWKTVTAFVIGGLILLVVQKFVLPKLGIEGFDTDM